MEYPHLPPSHPVVVTGELNSIPPKKRAMISLSNVKPSKLKMARNFKLFQKKTVNGTELPTQNDMEKSYHNNTVNTIDSNISSAQVATDTHSQSGNVIYFEDNIQNSKEEVIEPIENEKTENGSSSRPPSSATLVNMSS
jgi:hypothetical protein